MSVEINMNSTIYLIGDMINILANDEYFRES